jgi:hypothetical protein
MILANREAVEYQFHENIFWNMEAGRDFMNRSAMLSHDLTRKMIILRLLWSSLR